MALALTGLLIAVGAGRFHGGLVLLLILAYLAFFASCVGRSSGHWFPRYSPTMCAAWP